MNRSIAFPFLAPLLASICLAHAPAQKPAVPAKLKNDAFLYYGIGFGKPQSYSFTITGRPTITGVDQFKVSSVDKDKVVIAFSETGGPDGDERAVMWLQPDGLYNQSYSPQKLKTPHVIELPAKLTPGSKWKDHVVISAEGQDFSLDSRYTVAGTRKITTKAGSFDTVYVVSKGEGKVGATTVQVSTESWFAKGRGVVKQTMRMQRGSTVTSVTKELLK